METVLRAPFRGPGARVPGVGRQPGRDRRAADAPGAAGRRRRRGRSRGPATTVEIDLPAEPADVPAADRAARGLQDLRSLLLGFDVDPQDREPGAGRLPGRPRRARRPAAAAASSSCCTVFADLSELSRNQPGRRARGRAGQPGAQPARVLPQLPAEPRRRARRRCRRAFQARLHAGARPLRRRPTWTARRSWRPRSSGSSWPSSGRPPTSRWCPSCCGSGWPGRRRPEPLRERAGLALEHLVEATQVRFPAVVRPGPRRGVPLVRPAAAAPQPRQGLRRGARAPALPGPRTRTRRTAPSGSRPWWPAPSRWSG